MLQKRFQDFAHDTRAIGQERISLVNGHIDQLINAHHVDSAVIAESKDGLNEAWADLIEMIETRTQMLTASYELHKFFHDSRDLLDRILVSPGLFLIKKFLFAISESGKIMYSTE